MVQPWLCLLHSQGWWDWASSPRLLLRGALSWPCSTGTPPVSWWAAVLQPPPGPPAENHPQGREPAPGHQQFSALGNKPTQS